MSSGIVVLVAAVVAGLLLSVLKTSDDGRFRATRTTGSTRTTRTTGTRRATGTTASTQTTGTTQTPGTTRATGTAPVSEGRAVSATDHGELITAEDIGADLGERATLLQFSSAFCAPCRATRRVLSEVETMVDGVRHVELDAESNLELVRRLNILRTPTVLVLDAAGETVTRASGAPRKADVIAALGAAVDRQAS